MSGRHSEPTRVTLELSRREASIVAAALRQYEPYWSPVDVEAAEKLTELVQEITELLERLREVEPRRPSGLLGTFSRTEPALHIVPPTSADDPDLPT